jgi:hypothetical protein
MKNLPEAILDAAEAQEIQTYGTNYTSRGYNKTRGNNRRRSTHKLDRIKGGRLKMNDRLKRLIEIMDYELQ